MQSPYDDLSDDYVRRLRAAAVAADAFAAEAKWLANNGPGYRLGDYLTDASAYAIDVSSGLASATAEFDAPHEDTLRDHADDMAMDAGDARYHAMRDERV